MSPGYWFNLQFDLFLLLITDERFTAFVFTETECSISTSRDISTIQFYSPTPALAPLGSALFPPTPTPPLPPPHVYDVIETWMDEVTVRLGLGGGFRILWKAFGRGEGIDVVVADLATLN